MSQPGEDYYSDGGDEGSLAQTSGSKGEAGDGAKTSILPRSFFTGQELKVGDKCEVTVMAIHENDVEVEPVPMGKQDDDEQEPDEEDQSEGAPEESEEPPPAAEPPAAEGSMASMMG